jgi:hypothetical protein
MPPDGHADRFVADVAGPVVPLLSQIG